MRHTPFAAVQRHLHDLAARDDAERTDAELLQRFRDHRDESAFSTLVRRHGRMVLGVCRQVLGHEHDAEDAFQATFLVLARGAASIRQGAALPGWLYAVAHRVARAARRAAEQRQARERRARPVAHADPQLDLAWRELQAVLAEEVQRLPERLRAPFVLCCLEGKSKAEAAAQLGWKEGTVSGRLADARKRMQQRLTRRGLTLSAALCAGSLSAGEALALPPPLLTATVRAVLGVATGQAAAVSAPVAALAEGVTRAMLASKGKALTLLVLALGLLGAGAAVGLHRAFADPGVATEPNPPAAQKTEPAPADPGADPMRKVFTYAGRVLGPDGEPWCGAKLFIKGLTPGVVEFRARGVSDPNGTFRFDVRRDEFGEKGVVRPDRDPPEQYVAIAATAEGCGAVCVRAGTPEERANLTLWLPAEEIITGRVVDLEGKPIAGVHVGVDLRSAQAGKDNKPLPFDAPAEPGSTVVSILPHDARHVGVTDKDGRVILRGLSHGWLYDLSIWGPTVVNAKAQLVARPDKPKEVGGHGVWTQEKGEPKLTRYGSTFTFVAVPCKPIVGVVREKGTGKPIADADVRTPFRRDDEPVAWAKTDKDGKYRLTGLPPGVYTLTVRAPANTPYIDTESKVDASTPGIAAVTHDIEVERQPAVTGRLTDAATGKPVKGWVEYRPLARNPNLKANPLLANFQLFAHHPPSAATDGEGRFTLPVLRGPGVLLVSAEGDYLPARLEKADRVAGVADTADPELIDCRPLPVWPETCQAYRLLDVDGPKDAVVAIALRPALARPLVIEFPDGKPRGTTVFGLKPIARDSREQYFPGRTRVVGLADGETRRLFVTTHDGQLAAAAIVSTRETGPVTVKLQPVGVLTGRLLNREGKPIVGVSFQMLFDDGPGRRGVFVHSGYAARLPTPAESRRQERTSGYLSHRDEYQASWEKTDEQGRFRVVSVLPDVTFDLRVQLLGPADAKGRRSITDMVKIARTTVKPGQTLELGDVRAVESPRK
jgi:RNA polymerase sigma factor (sigma-70 family)